MLKYHRFKPTMCSILGIFVVLWVSNFRKISLFTVSNFKTFFLQMTKFQTSSTKIPNIQMISLSRKKHPNIKFKNSKLDVCPCESGSMPSSLWRTQNQASLTSWHSQNKCTLSCNTPHAVLPHWSLF